MQANNYKKSKNKKYIVHYTWIQLVEIKNEKARCNDIL